MACLMWWAHSTGGAPAQPSLNRITFSGTGLKFCLKRARISVLLCELGRSLYWIGPLTFANSLCCWVVWTKPVVVFVGIGLVVLVLLSDIFLGPAYVHAMEWAAPS